MRFDDRLDTLLKQSAPDREAKAALWVQIADIVSQEGNRLSSAQQEAAFERLRAWREQVPAARRRATSLTLSSYPVSPEMVDLFAQDSPQVAAPLLLNAQLPDAEWVRMIPGWPPTSRALVRQRRDLPEETLRLLGAYGTVDFVLPAEEGATESPESVIQIRDLVARSRRIGGITRQRRLGLSNQTDSNFPVPRLAAMASSTGWKAPPRPIDRNFTRGDGRAGGYGVDGQAAARAVSARSFATPIWKWQVPDMPQGRGSCLQTHSSIAKMGASLAIGASRNARAPAHR
ncbi:MAG: hypothetical protein IPO97_05355 [Sphingomonadales bacterium]|nr:hypothetical protein [Sphingomonadales bacterium]